MATTSDAPAVPSWQVPDWGLPPGVGALQTLRGGGESGGPWHGFNLGDHVGDDPAAVAANRARLLAALPVRPRWLRQVHGFAVCDLDCDSRAAPEADAAVTRERREACVVMTADCLPLLLSAADGSVVAAAHAGWRGLLGGVVEAAVAAMRLPRGGVRAWLGPAIGPAAFVVGDEVRAAFVAESREAAAAFAPAMQAGEGAGEGVSKQAAGGGKYHADLYALARLRLARVGVSDVAGGGVCTFADAARYYSYRRDGVSGRMASLIWRE